jgi:hypothetical protein
MLAKRLTRRGVVFSGGSLAVLLSQNVASASVPTSLMLSTVKAASVLATGISAVGVISPKVAALMEGVMKSMTLTKLNKAAMAGLVVLCIGGLGIGGYQALLAEETKTTITTTTITTRTKHKTSISGRWTGNGVNSLGQQSPAEMVVTEAPDGTLTGTWGAPMCLPIQFGERVTKDTFRWEGSDERGTYVARCTQTGNSLVIHWTCDNPRDGKTPSHSGTIVMTRQTTPKPDAAEEQEATTTTTTTTTKQSKTDPRLEGTWKLIEHENSGVKTGDWNFVMTFANGSVVMAGDEACGPGEGAFTTVVYPKGNRNDLDVTFTEGSNKGKTCYYSYRVEGDTLHIVGHNLQHDRIRWMTISSPAGSGVSHHVLQRVTPQTTANEEVPFFNGKNLYGWQGLPGYWKVRDGAIIGAPANGIKAHTFLCSEKTYRDFELKFKVKRKGGIGNSGVQIRSKIENRERLTVTGPQIEIDSANFRNPPGSIVTEPVAHPHIKANAAAVADVWEDDGFNDMTIRCEGKWVTVTINGVEVLDTRFPSMPEEGIIAWQLHGGSGGIEAPKEVIFKDIHFKELNVAKNGKTTTKDAPIKLEQFWNRLRREETPPQSKTKAVTIASLVIQVNPIPTPRLFRFHDGTSAGYYLNKGNGVWLESTGCEFRLEETTDEYMQIIRSDDGIRVRLPLRGGEALCKIGDENWRHLFWGSWR